ncbi:MAG: hypothetical protein R6X06_07265, partial [Gammaproteobacteria bacterium]
MMTIDERLSQAKDLLETGKSEAGRMVLLELLRDTPDNPAALLMLGGAYFYEKKFAEAEMVYQ